MMTAGFSAAAVKVGAMVGLCLVRAPGACCGPEGPRRGLGDIIMVVVDDLGWNDVGFHNRELVGQPGDIETAHIDALASAGVRLDAYYVQPLCSPTRTTLLSGRYAYTTGMAGEQHFQKTKRELHFRVLDRMV